MIDYRKRLARARDRIAAIRELVTLFTGVVRFGDRERITRMLDLHYAEVNGTDDPQLLEAWVKDMPDRLESV